MNQKTALRDRRYNRIKLTRYPPQLWWSEVTKSPYNCKKVRRRDHDCGCAFSQYFL